MAPPSGPVTVRSVRDWPAGGSWLPSRRHTPRQVGRDRAGGTHLKEAGRDKQGGGELVRPALFWVYARRRKVAAPVDEPELLLAGGAASQEVADLVGAAESLTDPRIRLVEVDAGLLPWAGDQDRRDVGGEIGKVNLHAELASEVDRVHRERIRALGRDPVPRQQRYRASRAVACASGVSWITAASCTILHKAPEARSFT